MRRSSNILALAIALGATACSESEVGVAPPGTNGGGNARLFYPISLALDPCGDHLYIANSNFDRAFSDGSLVSIPTSLFTPSTAQQPVPFPTDLTQPGLSVGLLDTFASNMIVSPAVPLGSVPCPNPAAPPTARLYATTRNEITLSTAFLGSDGTIQCPVNSSNVQDCSSDAMILGLKAPFFDDPFALTLAQTTLPGAAAPQSVVLVSHLSQEPTNSNGVGLDTSLIVIPEPPQGTLPQAGPSPMPFSQYSWIEDLGQPGSNSIVVGPQNQVVVGGCFLLVPGGTQAPCLNNTNNLIYYHDDPLRSFFLDVGPGAFLSSVGIGSLVGTAVTGGGAITDMGKSSDGTSLYIAMEQPDALVVMPFPQPAVVTPPVPSAIIPLLYTPQRITVLPRPQGDLIAVAVTESNSFIIVDPVLGIVVTQLEGIGNQPFGITAMPVPLPATGPMSPPPTMYRVFVAMFNDCQVDEIDVPVDAPEQAAVRSVIGDSCVQTSQQMVLFQGLL